MSISSGEINAVYRTMTDYAQTTKKCTGVPRIKMFFEMMR